MIGKYVETHCYGRKQCFADMFDTVLLMCSVEKYGFEVYSATFADIP